MSEVLKRLVEIKKEIGHLKKESKGVHGNCRSIYDTYLATHDPFVKHGIIMTSGGLSDGNIAWTFHCMEDGSSITTFVPMIDLGNQIFDAGKAISYSQKYAIISALCLPDQSVNQSDPDVTGSSSTEPDESEKPRTKKPLPTPKERIEASRGPKLTDKAWLYQKMIEYQINPDYHGQIYIWAFDDAKSGGQDIIGWGGSLGEEKFKAVILEFSNKAAAEVK